MPPLYLVVIYVRGSIHTEARDLSVGNHDVLVLKEIFILFVLIIQMHPVQFCRPVEAGLSSEDGT